MRVAVDALPINNFSGRRVLLGHLRNLAAAGRGRHSFHVLHHAGNRDLRRDLGENVEWLECASGAQWTRRLIWQRLAMRGLLRRIGADILLSTSGALTPGADIPQVVLAQNPWCFFPAFHRSANDKLKASLQRFGYRRAQRRAEAVFYLSDYLASAYRENAGAPPRHGETLYVGVDDGVFAAAGDALPHGERELAILTVSVMARHKAIGDILDALQLLHARGVMARLYLVGPWADADYRREIAGRIQRSDLGDYVSITGAVDDAELAAYYRRSRVFCLLSRCESFGIPAVEAQLFGTPCVVADACAPPEIAGPGGLVVPLADAQATALALEGLLENERQWATASKAALTNVERFRWDRVSEPLLRYLDRRGTSA
ncbi:glycosyltransferase [Arenimonas sp.]|uniref:glycosyltransferase n=1 Tax=Arenimonas sp. TaxID=1872635 RepID=UPI0039E41A1A